MTVKAEWKPQRESPLVLSKLHAAAAFHIMIMAFAASPPSSLLSHLLCLLLVVGSKEGGVLLFQPVPHCNHRPGEGPAHSNA